MSRNSRPDILTTLLTLAAATALQTLPGLPSLSQADARVPAAAGTGRAAGAFFLPSPDNAEDVTILLGTGGSVHAAVRSYESMALGAYYAFCASNCGNVANWTGLGIGDIGPYGGSVRLALTPAGQPRMMWLNGPLNGDPTFEYAECNSNCTNIANWTQGSVATKNGAYVGPGRCFAIDPQGQPRFLFYGSGRDGTFYASCDADCTVAANWQKTQISTAYLAEFSLVFDAQSRPRVAYMNEEPDPEVVRYATCDADCNTAASWTETALFYSGGDGAFALRLDPNGRPRIALYQGNVASTDPAGDKLLSYWWCDSDCTQGSNWYGRYMGSPQEHGLGVELVLDGDAQARPRLAYYTNVEPYGMFYARCTANCESIVDEPTWEGGFVEKSAEVQASNPVPVVSGCLYSLWFVGEKPSLLVDGAGNPLFGYNARHNQSGFGNCNERDDIKLVRIASGLGTTPDATPSATITPGAASETPTATPTAANTLTPGGPTLTPTITPGGPTLTPTITPGGPTLTPTPPGGGSSPTPTSPGGSPSPTRTPIGGGPSPTRTPIGGAAIVSTFGGAQGRGELVLAFAVLLTALLLSFRPARKMTSGRR